MFNTNLDTNIDLTDCALISVVSLKGGKLIIHLIPELATIECNKCDEYARYHVLMVNKEHEDNDLVSNLCNDHYIQMFSYIENEDNPMLVH